MKSYAELCEFERGAVDGLAFTGTRNMDGVTETYEAPMLWEALDEEDKERFLTEIGEFYVQYEMLWVDDYAAGVDYVLTRRRTGSGFDDGDYPEHGKCLAAAARCDSEGLLLSGFSALGEDGESTYTEVFLDF